LPGTGKADGIYKGVVEDNKDPEKRGRIRARIIGIHTNVKEISDTMGVPTSSLPWVEPVLSPFEGAISGFGIWSIPVQGSHIYIFFESGNIMQPRYFGSCAGIPKKKAEPKIGFNDPDGIYPLEDLLGKPDWNALARDEVQNTIVEKRKQNKLKNISTATGDKWEEPDPFYYDTTDKYPENIVIATHGGLLFEIDNTKDKSRFSFYHPNAYWEINKDGKMVFCNKEDRYDICLGKYYQYYKDKKFTTIGGEEAKIVTEDRTVVVSKKETVTIGDKQSIGIRGEQCVGVKGSQTLSTIGTQTTGVKGSRKVGVWGSQETTIKGSGKHSVMGAFNMSSLSAHLSSITGFSVKQSNGPHKVGSSTITTLGKGPITKATASLNSALSGINAAMRDAMQPLLDTFEAINNNVIQQINEAVRWANEITQPITEIVNQAQQVTEYVKQEMSNVQQFINNVQQAPFAVASSISGYINKIINSPGYLVQNIINQVSAVPAQLNTLKALTTLYSSVNDLSTFNLQIQKQNYDNLFNGMFDLQGYSFLGDIFSYNRSGLAGYSSGIYSKTSIIDNSYYMTGVAPSATTSYAQSYGSGSLGNELIELDSFVTQTLCASHIDIYGVFDINSAIAATFAPVVEVQYDYLLRNGTIWDFLGNCKTETYINPSGGYVTKQNCFIDQIVLDDFGNIIETQLTSAGYLTIEQQTLTIGDLELLEQILLDGRIDLWGQIGTNKSIQELVDIGALSPSTLPKIRYDGETDEEFNSRINTFTPLTLLNITIAEEIYEELEQTKINLHNFAAFNVAQISASYVDFFSAVLTAEQEIIDYLKTIDLDTIEWEGKNSDFVEAV
jgi:hypothetical protein